MINWEKYPHLDSIAHHNYRFLKTALFKPVYWERKRDGSNLSLAFHKDFPIIFTRNQKAIESTELSVKKLLKPHMDNLKAMLGEQRQLNFEWLTEGKSPAQFEINPSACIKAFDVYDFEQKCWLHPSLKYLLFRKYHIPHTALHKKTVSRTVEGFKKLVNKMIDKAYDRWWEGFVAKWATNDDIQMIKAKVEHKYTIQKEPKPKQIADKRETLEISEITGAILRVYNELGEDFRDKRLSMPAIAKAVSEEERKHSRKNREKLYIHYLEFLENLEE